MSVDNASQERSHEGPALRRKRMLREDQWGEVLLLNPPSPYALRAPVPVAPSRCQGEDRKRPRVEVHIKARARKRDHSSSSPPVPTAERWLRL